MTDRVADGATRDGPHQRTRARFGLRHGHLIGGADLLWYGHLLYDRCGRNHTTHLLRLAEAAAGKQC